MEKQLIFQMEDKYQDYLVDESKFYGYADSISFPEREDEIIAIVNRMKKEGTPVTIQGGKTGIVGGAVPQGGHIMNLSHMNRVIDSYQKDGECYIVVEPGIILMDLQQEITRHFKGERLMWAPSPTETTATVGGVAATNARGINSIYYGDSKQYIQGLRVVLSDGSVQIMERDQETKLDEVLGTEGVLGVITQLTLRLVKKKEDIWGVTFFFEQDQALFQFADILRQFEMQTDEAEIAAMEYMDKTAIVQIEKRKSTMAKIREVPDIDSNYCGMVYIEIQGKEESIEELTAKLMDAAEECGCDLDQAWAVSGENEIDKMRAFRHAAAEVTNLSIEEQRREEPAITKLGTDIALDNSFFSEVVTGYKADLEMWKLQGCIFGHIADNHLHVNILPSSLEEYQRGICLLKQWTDSAREKREKVVCEHGIGKLKKAIYGNLLSQQEIEYYQSLKKSYDPIGMWNPGDLI